MSLARALVWTLAAWAVAGAATVALVIVISEGVAR
jgi:hypothetical protein